VIADTITPRIHLVRSLRGVSPQAEAPRRGEE